MPTYTDIAKSAAVAAVREVKPYITALETKIQELEGRLHKIETTPPVANPHSVLSDADTRLYNILREKRAEIAAVISAPLYVVATNKCLRSMIEHKPRNLEEMKCVFGMGKQKIRMYGRAFLNTLVDNYDEFYGSCDDHRKYVQPTR